LVVVLVVVQVLDDRVDHDVPGRPVGVDRVVAQPAVEFPNCSW